MEASLYHDFIPLSLYITIGTSLVFPIIARGYSANYIRFLLWTCCSSHYFGDLLMEGIGEHIGRHQSKRMISRQNVLNMLFTYCYTPD